jgi:hypothetical protein
MPQTRSSHHARHTREGETLIIGLGALHGKPLLCGAEPTRFSHCGTSWLVGHRRNGRAGCGHSPSAWRAALHPTLALHPPYCCYGKTAMAFGLRHCAIPERLAPPPHRIPLLYFRKVGGWVPPVSIFRRCIMCFSLCGQLVCQHLCVRAQHCQAGLVRRCQLLAAYQQRRLARRLEVKQCL